MTGSCRWVVLLSAVLLGTVKASPLPSPGDYDPRLSPLELSIIKTLVDALPGDSNGGGGTPEWTILSSQSRELQVPDSGVLGQKPVFEVQSGGHEGEGGPDDSTLIRVVLGELAPVDGNGRTKSDYRLSGEHENGGSSDNWTIVKSISTELHLRSKNHDLLNNQHNLHVPKEQNQEKGPPEQPAGEMISKEIQPPVTQPGYQALEQQTLNGHQNEWSTGYTLSKDELPPFFDDPESQFYYQQPVEPYPVDGITGNQVYPIPGQEFGNVGWNDYPGEYNGGIGSGSWDSERSELSAIDPYGDGDERFAPPEVEKERKDYDIDIRMSAEEKLANNEQTRKLIQNQDDKIDVNTLLSTEIQPPEKSFRNQKSHSVSGDQEARGDSTNYNIVPEVSSDPQPAENEVPASIREMLPPAADQGQVTQGSWIAVPLEGGEAPAGRSIAVNDTTTEKCEPGYSFIMNMCRKVYNVQLSRRIREPDT